VRNWHGISHGEHGKKTTWFKFSCTIVEKCIFMCQVGQVHSRVCLELWHVISQ